MDTNQILREQIEITPPEVKTILKENSWSLVAERIAAENNFLEEQRDSFENEILFVLLGMELLKNFAQNLRINAGLIENKAIEIASEIHEKIFKNIEHLLPTDIEEFPPSETKEEVMRRLMEQRGNVKAKMPEVAPHNLPMVEPDQTAHTVEPLAEVREEPPVLKGFGEPKEKPKLVQTPNYGYPDGKDPYREPIE